MENKFICFNFCNGELIEKKDYLLLSDVMKFLELAEDPIIIYGKVLYEKGD